MKVEIMLVVFLFLAIAIAQPAAAQERVVSIVDVLLYHYSTIEWTVESDALFETISTWSHSTITQPTANALSAYLSAPSAELRVFAQVSTGDRRRGDAPGAG